MPKRTQQSIQLKLFNYETESRELHVFEVTPGGAESKRSAARDG